MPNHHMITVDGNQAAASVAHRINEVIALYPITPSSPMGELCDEWAAQGRTNIWGTVPQIMEMQSEAGASGTVHGALQAGALVTTFTASQGLLLMIPNLYKIAGELNPYCMHVAARTVATHALSIFGDHSDVMACRQTGCALLASGSIQEVHDLACIAQSASLRSRIPAIHFFDGFRTSHEIGKIQELTDEELRAMIDDDLLAEHRRRALNPEHPFVRGTAQNPDTFFQTREAASPYYLEAPEHFRAAMRQFAEVTGRTYHLFDYVGHPEAERVIVIMGSGAEATHETVEYLAGQGERVGMVKVRVYRPFSVGDFLAALPATTRAIAAMDRTKEPGSIGDPLYLDVLAALDEGHRTGAGPAQDVQVLGGRYGLSSKEFNPPMVKAVLDELGRDEPRRHFTVGIVDDVCHTSLEVDPTFDTEPDDVRRCVFYGLGADGTVGANKNSIKIIGEETENHAQGYFIYDSRKSGAMTISHLRFGPRPIRSTYRIGRANFVACSNDRFLEKVDVLETAAPGAVFLLNTPHPPEQVWDRLPREVQEAILERQLEVHVIDANEVARQTGMGRRTNSIMQTCFFALSGVLPRDEAIARIKEAIKKTYSSKGQEVVERNYAAVDQALSHLHRVEVPGRVTSTTARPAPVAAEAPDHVKNVAAVMMVNQGDSLPVSCFPVDGTWPSGTTQWEKRNIALEIPVWEPDLCIQCNRCSFVCPHATIRAKVCKPEALEGAPGTFKSTAFRSRELPDHSYVLQVAPEDCTGCTLCVQVCPAKDKANPRRKAINMQPQPALRSQERENYAFFLELPSADLGQLKVDAKNSQFREPLFEYSGACEGCGETPYVKLLTQLFGDRLLIANATGCSSIYGANLPTTPYTFNADGRGPAWSNSLFEDNAEFGLGFRLSVDQLTHQARTFLQQVAGELGDTLVTGLLEADQGTDAGIEAQRERVAVLREKLQGMADPSARSLAVIADYLVRKSVWIVGGDGWAYDIGYGGLDHVLAQGRDVNILVLDTEVYSNTGGQQSKATPLGAAAKFASAGKAIPKKDLGMMAMAYGSAYVARVAFGASDRQTVRAFLEAEAYPGSSLIIAYSHCIAHGYDLSLGLQQQQLAVDSGYWPLLRFDPRLMAEGKNPLQLDSKPPKIPLRDYVQTETRYRMVEQQDPQRFAQLMQLAQQEVRRRFGIYEQLAQMQVEPTEPRS